MNFTRTVSDRFIVSQNNFNNEEEIKNRIDSYVLSNGDNEVVAKNIRSVLMFIYFDNAKTNISKKAIRKCEEYLNDAEQIIARYLCNFVTGKRRRKYGKRAVLVAKRAKYRCENCGLPDVRTLEMDHVDNCPQNINQLKLELLCGSCHNVKGRKHVVHRRNI